MHCSCQMSLAWKWLGKNEIERTMASQKLEWQIFLAEGEAISDLLQVLRRGPLIVLNSFQREP